MRAWFRYVGASLIVCAAALAAPVQAETLFNPALTEQENYPQDLPAPYSEVFTKVLDLTTMVNPTQPWIQFEYMDKKLEREATGFRSVIREMMDLQTMDSETMRTRDLPSPYTTSLSAFSGYYRTVGAEYPGGGLQELQKEELSDRGSVRMPPPRVEPIVPAAPRPAAPVPALW